MEKKYFGFGNSFGDFEREVFVDVSVLRSLVVMWCTHGCLTSKVTKEQKKKKASSRRALNLPR